MTAGFLVTAEIDRHEIAAPPTAGDCVPLRVD